MYRTTFLLRSPGAFTLYRCRGSYSVILHGMHLGTWEGEVNESLPGACPPGHRHAVIYKRLTSEIYTQLVGCLLCTLERTSCGRLRKLWARRYGRRNKRTVCTHTSKPSQPWTHQRQPIYVRIGGVRAVHIYSCPWQLLARYHNLRKSIPTFEKRLLFVPSGYNADWTPPPQTRYGTACISQQLSLRLHHMLYSRLQSPSHPF